MLMSTSLFQIVDEGEFTLAKGLYTGTNLTSIAVEASSLFTGSYPVTYTFTVIPKAIVTKGAYLLVTIPPELTVPSTNSLNGGC